jgi:protein-L-isoaspartate(D-aspartate) O-methyltransferase
MSKDRFEAARERMVADQLVARGIADRRVLAAFAKVPREAFVPPEFADRAYEDNPLPIGEGQTISQPFIVALMAEAAEIAPEARILEVGAGSGYAAAILAALAREVVTIERHASLAAAAKAALAKLGIGNVTVIEGDGSRGFPERAPFDAILVAAAAPALPAALRAQLAEGGRLVIPVDADGHQDLLVITRHGERFEETSLGPVRFVPLVASEESEPG